jgi:hypothetical protein
MFLRRRRSALTALVAALAVGAPVGLASAAASPATDPVITGPSCPDGYRGPTNPATGCPYWLMSYTVEYAGQAPVRCPPGWQPPGSASAARAAADSPGRAAPTCAGIATAS